DMSMPFCPKTRPIIVEELKNQGLSVRDKAVLLCTEGPRFETPAEIEMFHRLGCDIVGMTSVTEAILSRELEMCYTAICFITNMAAGMQKSITPSDVFVISKNVSKQLEQALIATIAALPLKRSCTCSKALKESRF
ncbi:MAG: MTAP family purine nucleoside phosphorylase, partial [Crenarchaeota archaeon]|nr:MTAP family purine nucleoside phosphorylase [Thermoproteota archaeon]